MLDRLSSFSRQLRIYLAAHPAANLAAGIATMVAACGLVLLGPVVIALLIPTPGGDHVFEQQ
jgi:hypothetical protein